MAVLVAIALVVLIGFVALGTEVVALLMTSRQMQVAADSAALAASTAKTDGYPAAFGAEAVAVATDRGFTNGGNTTVAVNSPPVSGNYSGNTAAVQVVITRVQSMLLSALSHNAAYTLTARAVGLAGEQGACALVLDPSAAAAALFDNGVHILLNKCGLAVNSSATGAPIAQTSALVARGGADLTASWLNVVGNTSVTNAATVTITGATRTAAAAVANPYAARVLPGFGTCLGGGTISNQNVALPQGTYCAGGINISNLSNVTLSGVYVLKDSSFVVNASTVSGTATIVLAGTGTGASIGSVTISNSATVSLTAQTAVAATAGMVFFQDIRAPAAGINAFTNATSVTLNGAVYFPNTTLNFSGGTSTASVCTQLIARMINFTGNTTIRVNCAGYGTVPIAGVPGRLVE